MEKVVKFYKNVKNTDYEQERERYKKDFQEYLKRKENRENLIYLDTRKRM